MQQTSLAMEIEKPNQTNTSPFICLSCQTPIQVDALTPEEENQSFSCQNCDATMRADHGIPILLRNEKVIASLIKEARSSQRADWYEEVQDHQFTGAYRHHFKKRRAYLDKQLKKLLGDQKVATALDIGCGDGNHIDWLKTYADTVYASDYNVTRLLRAQKKVQPGNIVLADITDYPATDESFDLIFFNHVLEHIPEDEKALEEVYRILKKDGILIIGVPNEGAMFSKIAYKLQPHLMETTDHVNFYTMKNLKEKALALPFESKAEKHIGYGVPHFTADRILRNYKILDDLFGFFGNIIVHTQSTSLYLILRKSA